MTQDMLQMQHDALRSGKAHRDPQSPQTHSGKSSPLDRWLLRKLLSRLEEPPITFVLPGGDEVSSRSNRKSCRVVIRNRTALWKMALDPLYHFAEGYTNGAIDLEDLGGLLQIVFERFESKPAKKTWIGSLTRYLRLPHSNTLRQSRKNIHRHYDIGNDFYRLWLDHKLLYTCAYFENSEQTLEEAQLAKMDHVCRKLRLQPGMQVIEAGCGWGSLALHMAQRYGVHVRAFNISHNQIEYARHQASKLGLKGQVEFIEDDWRNIDGVCDAFASVGMLEHVGVRNYGLLGQVMDACLTPNGLGLIHSIGQNDPRPVSPWIEQNIFPGAYPPALGEMMAIFEPHRFSVLDVENLRLHYAETLHHWLERFEEHTDEIGQKFDEKFVRMWRFYLTGSMLGFATGSLQLFQVVFARSANNALPMTRAHLY